MTVLKRIIGAEWLRTLAVATGMAVFLCLIGALGSTAFSFPLRLAYWLTVMLAGTVIARVAGTLLDRLSNLNIGQEIVAILALIVPPITLMVWLVSTLFDGRSPDVARIPAFILPVAIVSLAMALLHVLVNRTPAQSHAFVTRDDSEQPPRQTGERLRKRLPFKFQTAELYAISSEDHYLRVYSSVGETLVLMRLSDAIAELDGIEGSQTHRSWWVAKDAVTDVKRNDGRVTLLAKGGVAAPVSRAFHKSLKDGGWF